MRIAETRLAGGWLILGLLLPPAYCQPLAEASLGHAGVRLAAPRPAIPYSAIFPGPRFLKETRRRRATPSVREARAYQHTFRVLLSHPETTDPYDSIILRHATEHGLDPRLVKAVVAAESEFDPGARSPSGALGLMQLMPATAAEVGIPARRLHEPEANIAAGTSYLEVLFATAWKRYNMQGVPYSESPIWLVRRVLAAYNAGPRRLIHPRGAAPGYVDKILLYYQSAVTDIRRPSAKSLFSSVPRDERLF
ncbi:MAG TPA: transglycosylase SLT domain-containing protein [Elusimicrobiota bacterium]|nr:transglycosylase SLT domain-containing protein [Elusimicrobiota bacterium]